MNREGYMPSKKGFFVAGAILLVGFVTFAIMLVTGLVSGINNMDYRIVVPGREIIEFTEAGEYNIFFEYISNIDGKVFQTESVSGMMCGLINTETEELVTLETPTSSSSYTVSGREGKNILEFSIDEPGTYQFEAWYEGGEGEEAVFAIGKGFVKSLGISIVLSILILFVSIGLAVAIFIRTLVVRSRARKADYS